MQDMASHHIQEEKDKHGFHGNIFREYFTKLCIIKESLLFALGIQRIRVTDEYCRRTVIVTKSLSTKHCSPISSSVFYHQELHTEDLHLLP